MCSVFGYYKIKNNEAHRDFASMAFDSMRHRGPDNEAFVAIDEKAGLGHQRLAIIDTRDEANQPMRAGDNYLVFNGEIYNYIELKNEFKAFSNFKTTSDTEVLLKGIGSMGVRFLNKCNGMFAFASYNKREKKLILARDRFGVKPLHYMIQDNIFYFSSEIKPLIKIKDRLEKNMKIYDSFINDVATDFDEQTFIKGIYQLKKGYYLACSGSGIEVKQWYQGTDFGFDEKIFENEAETLEFTETLLSDSIAKRLRSDVPVCITLSGGLDSTTIYTLAKERLRQNVKPFTFRHYGAKTDEYEKVKKLVSSYGDEICCVRSDHRQGHKGVEEALNYLEFPTWNLSALAYLDMYKAIRGSGFVVTLEGHGSDEQLGGYPLMVRSAVFEYIKNFKIKDAVRMYKVLSDTNNPDLQQNNSFLRFWGSFVKNIIVKRRLDISFSRTAENMFDYKILPIILRTFDRLPMRSSVESRSPFMDYRLVEFFKKMPLKYKVSEIGSKAILRKILKKYNKDFIYKDRKKMGFAYDIPAFFRISGNKEYMKEKLLEFNMKKYKKIKKKALREREKSRIGWINADPIWKIASLSVTNQMYGI